MKKLFKSAAVVTMLMAGQVQAAPLLQDTGFETVNVGANSWSSFRYTPTGSAWTFTGGGAISGNGSGFTYGNPVAPEGGQVGVLQGGSGTTISQSFQLTSAAKLDFSFYSAQRAYYGTQDFNVLLDNIVIGSFTPTSTSYLIYQTAQTLLQAGNHTLTFQGVNSFGGDHTVFLDDVKTNVSAVPVPAALWLFGSSLVGLIGVRKKKS